MPEGLNKEIVCPKGKNKKMAPSKTDSAVSVLDVQKKAVKEKNQERREFTSRGFYGAEVQLGERRKDDLQ